MENNNIQQTIDFIKKVLKNAEKGHNWFHIQRVYKNAIKIHEQEGGDKLVIQLAALLHDISDAKFNGGDEKEGKHKAIEFLTSIKLSEDTVSQVAEIVEKVSFKGGLNDDIEKTLELKIVQDADRLDAIGAIGIARTFHYGGFKNREIYNPEIPFQKYQSAEEYHASEAPTINHFYEKLLLLKDKMNTKTGKEMAEKRHFFMENFLEQFYEECE